MSAERSTSRRDVLIAGGALVAAASVPALLRPRGAGAQERDDVSILREAIELELVMAEAYERAAPALGGIARLFRNHERAHAEELTSALRELGGGGDAPSAGASTRIGELGSLRGRDAAVRGLTELEREAIAMYVEAHRSIRDARLMRTVSSILAVQAQHLAALRDLAGDDPSPVAFETGRG